MHTVKFKPGFDFIPRNFPTLQPTGLSQGEDVKTLEEKNRIAEGTL